MRTDIHPDYEAVSIRCSCGNVIETRSTGGDQSVELCSECHPFYTGKQKLVDTGGRIDRFERRYGRRKKAGAQAASEPDTAEPPTAEAADTPKAPDAAEPAASAEPTETTDATEGDQS